MSVRHPMGRQQRFGEFESPAIDSCHDVPVASVTNVDEGEKKCTIRHDGSVAIDSQRVVLQPADDLATDEIDCHQIGSHLFAP